MITLQQDIQVSIVDGKEYFAWPTSPTPMGGRGETSLIPAPEGYSPTDLFWITNNVIELPSGYSLLVTHPNNRFDLPFLTLSGIVDADGLMTSGRLPFFIKSGFSGVIPKGTPICQILPFKREAWRLLEDPALVEKNHKNSWLSSSVVFGWYKRSIWQRKIYD
ncbi:MAG: hypothetical protein EBS38_03055 [Actinobacteria bacterium]|nr:hypothetical protein [Actinomycetota bacterium]